MQSLATGAIPAETEHLTETNRLNEYIMTSLRTARGLDLTVLNTIAAAAANPLLITAQEFLDKEWIIKNNEVIYLTQTGKLYADHIAAELFFEE